MLKHIVNTR